jgi:archaetidylinositol phosphate synthase
MRNLRVYNGYFSSIEQKLIKALLLRVPERFSPDHLSFLALLGACICATGLIGTWVSSWYLVAAAVGLFLHWLGDSLDGAVARSRGQERPMAGFLIDRCGDILSFFVMIAGLGLSPFLTILSASFAFVTVLLMMVNTLLIHITQNRQVLGSLGLGGTEARIIGAVWVAVVHFSGNARATFNFETHATWDIAAGVGMIVIICLLGFHMLSRIKIVSNTEKTTLHNENVINLPTARSAVSESKPAANVVIAIPGATRDRLPPVKHVVPNLSIHRRRI